MADNDIGVVLVLRYGLCRFCADTKVQSCAKRNLPSSQVYVVAFHFPALGKYSRAKHPFNSRKCPFSEKNNYLCGIYIL